MSKAIEVPAEIREDVGKGASRRLRRMDKVPAVVYGEGRDPVNLSLEHDYILHAAGQEAFHASILTLNAGDHTEKVILRDLQRHPYKLRIMHVDFLRISEKNAVRISVPLHFANEAESPAGRKGGVVIQHMITELEIEALPKDLPEYIEVDMTNLEPGGQIMLTEIVLPEGVMVPALEYGEEGYDTAVVGAIFIREGQGSGELAAEADAALAEGAEPEVVDEESADDEDSESEGEEGGEDEGDADSEDKREGKRED